MRPLPRFTAIEFTNRFGDCLQGGTERALENFNSSLRDSVLVILFENSLTFYARGGVMFDSSGLVHSDKEQNFPVVKSSVLFLPKLIFALRNVSSDP
jgi:hypothetical protein